MTANEKKQIQERVNVESKRFWELYLQELKTLTGQTTTILVEADFPGFLVTLCDVTFQFAPPQPLTGVQKLDHLAEYELEALRRAIHDRLREAA